MPRIGLTRSGRTFLGMRRLAIRFVRPSQGLAALIPRLTNIGLFALDLRLFCGDEGDRTLNLRLAKPALSQLSYAPGSVNPAAYAARLASR